MKGELTKRIRNNDTLTAYSLTPEFPKNMLLDITNVCNNNCIFCANSKSSRKKMMMDLSFGKRILKEAYENGTREVGFYATGEPLVNKDLEEYISFAKQLGYKYVYITTNGVLLDKERSKSIIKAGIDSVKFSINASNARDYLLIHGKNDFEKVRQNVIEFNNARKDCAKSIRLFISCILTRYTQEIKDEMNMLFRNIADEIVFLQCWNQGGYMPEINKCLAFGETGGGYYPSDGICPMLFKNLYVSVEGYLTMCCTDFQNYLTVADLKKETLKEAWNGQYAQKLRQAHIEHHLEKTLCANCIQNTNRKIEPLVWQHATSFDYENFDSTWIINKRIMGWELDKEEK